MAPREECAKIGLKVINESTWESSAYHVALDQIHRLGNPKHEHRVGHDDYPWAW